MGDMVGFLSLGFIYGCGFIFTLLLGLLFLMIVNGRTFKHHPWKVLVAAIIWPITLSIVAYKAYKFLYGKDN